MPDEGQKSNLFSKIHHLFSKEEAEKTSDTREASQPRIGKMVMPDGTVRLPDGTIIEEEVKKAVEEPAELDIRFATRMAKVGAKFIYCESVPDLFSSIESLKRQNGWNYVYSWESRLMELFEANGFQEDVIGFTLENSNAAASLCEFLIAGTGDILLSSRQATRRQLPVFPRSHIIIADQRQLVESLDEAIHQFKALHKEELPSLINLSNQPRSVLESQELPVLDSGGPKDIYVFMSDEPLS